MKTKVFLLFIFLILQGSLMAAKIEYFKVKGLKVPVIFEEQKSLPILNLQLIFENSGYVKDGSKIGLASLSSKLLNEGTKELGSTKFAEKLDENAITIHSSTGFETFVIELSSLKEKSNEAINLLESLLKSPNFSQNSLEKVRTLQIGSIKRKENDFDYIASSGLNSTLFKGTPLENPVLGTVESISNINLSDIESFVKNYLVLSNLIVVAGGDINLKDLEKLLTSLLNSLEVGEKSSSLKIDFNSKVDEKTLIREDSQQAYIYFGSSFFANSKDEDNYKAKLSSFILGSSGFGSRLMEEIRVKRGLAYSAYSSISINRSYSYFSGYLQTKNDTSDEAKELVKDIIAKFVENGATKEELDASKRFLSGSEPLRTETLSQRLNRAFLLYFKGLNQDYSQKELEKIENLTLDDLNSYIKSHKELNNLTFFIVRR